MLYEAVLTWRAKCTHVPVAVAAPLRGTRHHGRKKLAWGAACVECGPDPFRETVGRTRSVGAALKFLRVRGEALLRSGEASYLVAGEVFDGEGEPEDWLGADELAAPASAASAEKPKVRLKAKAKKGGRRGGVVRRGRTPGPEPALAGAGGAGRPERGRD